MGRLALSRFLQAIVALLVLTLIVFAMARATGDARLMLLSPSSTQEDYDRLGRVLGLDKPLPVQYGIYLRGLFHGDMGKSISSGEQVSKLIWQRLKASVQLGAIAIVLSIAVGTTLGVLAAVYREGPVDGLIRLAALGGQSAPSFLVGLVLIQVFAVWLGWLPAGTRDGPSHVILPAATLALFGIAGITRLLRSSMLEVLDSEFVKLARSKGVPEVWVISKHALRNALLPVASFGGLFMISIISLAIITETVFAWPGMGLLTFTGIINRDFPVVQGVVLVTGGMAIFLNLVTDLLYSYLDPRIRYDRS